MSTEPLLLVWDDKHEKSLLFEITEGSIYRVFETETEEHLDDYSKEDILAFLRGEFKIRDPRGFFWDCNDPLVGKTTNIR